MSKEVGAGGRFDIFLDSALVFSMQNGPSIYRWPESGLRMSRVWSQLVGKKTVVKSQTESLKVAILERLNTKHDIFHQHRESKVNSIAALLHEPANIYPHSNNTVRVGMDVNCKSELYFRIFTVVHTSTVYCINDRLGICV